MPFINLFSGGGSSGNEPTGTDISSATVTLDSESFTYDGALKTKTVTSVVLSNTTLTYGEDYYVTNNEATNAGTYTLNVVGVGNYYGSATASWSIAKATPTLELDTYSVGLNTEMSETVTATSNIQNVPITATSSDTTVCTVSVSGNVITITSLQKEDSATITVSIAEGDNYTAISVTCSVVVQNFPRILADATPAQIQEAAQKGVASTLWNVGDQTAVIPISAGCGISAISNMCAFIIGFDHNSELEGTGIHFQFGKLSSGTYVAMTDSYYAGTSSSSYFSPNRSDTNSGAWNGSAMYSTTCPAFFNMLPAEWKAVIQKTDKYSANGQKTDSATYVTATKAEIWLLAEWEVFGARTYANSYEKDKQQQYDYYKNGNTKVRYKHNATSTTCYWMTRSCYIGSSWAFASVGTDGNIYQNSYGNISQGFAPGFRIA